MKPLLLSFALILLGLGLILNVQSPKANGLRIQEPVKNKTPSPLTWVQQENKPDKKTSQAKETPSEASRIGESQSNQQQTDTKDKPQWAAHWLWKEINWSGIAQAAVGAIGLWIIWRTLKAVEIQAIAAQSAANATTETVKAMQDTAERQLRAYIFVGAEQCLDLDRPVPPEFRIFIKNAGQTPAYDVFHWSNMGILPYPFKDEPPGPDPRSPMIKTVVAPGADFVSEHKGPPLLSADQIAQIKDGTKYRLYAWGQVLYRDIFGVNRTTKYRLMHGGPEIAPGTMHYCEEGNEAN